ncbi:sigma-70 family RNA polymerase sigma factor [Microbacterium sp. 1P10UB]|uniref:RNA polymerase sigma factor n=1 Tax=unclassified Microbacterium TaxID=2609290 RepID=UPI0039A2788E
MYRSVPVTEPNRSSAPDAWAVEVIRANGADLLSYLARRITPPADAADVLSDVLTVIWAKRMNIPQGVEPARMWSFGVARNALRTHRRRGYRQKRLADALRVNFDRLLPEQPIDPVEAAHCTQRRLDTQAAIRRLPKVDRELVMLVHWDDFTVTEAAQLLGVNASTARTRYSRARQWLAVELSDHRRVSPAPQPNRSLGLGDALQDRTEPLA